MSQSLIHAAGIQIEQGVEEKFDTLTSSTGTVTHDCSNGHVFYSQVPQETFSKSFYKSRLTAEYGTNVTVIINPRCYIHEVTCPR